MVWGNDPVDDSSDLDWKIHGRIVEADGSLPNPAFNVSANPAPDMDPDVASDGTGWYVVWCHDWNGSSNYDIRGKLLDGSGNVTWFVDPDVQNDNASGPSVAYADGKYFIAWEKGAAPNGSAAQSTHGRLAPAGDEPELRGRLFGDSHDERLLLLHGDGDGLRRILQRLLHAHDSRGRRRNFPQPDQPLVHRCGRRSESGLADRDGDEPRQRGAEPDGVGQRRVAGRIPDLGHDSRRRPDGDVRSVNVGGLAAGIYTATITVADPAANNPPQTISVTLTVNSPPAAPNGPGQFKSTGGFLLPGSTTNESMEILKASATDPDAGQAVQVEFELEPAGAPFDGTGTQLGAMSAVFAGLSNATAYPWRARAVDALNAASAWVSFGGNPEPSGVDFQVLLPATNAPPDAPASRKQWKAAGSAEIGIGSATNESVVLFRAILHDPEGTGVKLVVEVAATTDPGFGAPLTVESPFVASGTTASLWISGLSDGAYHWRARAVDAQGGDVGPRLCRSQPRVERGLRRLDRGQQRAIRSGGPDAIDSDRNGARAGSHDVAADDHAPGDARRRGCRPVAQAPG